MRPARRVAGSVVSAVFLCAALGASAAWSQAPRAQVLVLSNSSPHISVIDGQTHQVIRTADVPGLKAWGYNDANNYFDGRHLWLGAVDPDTRERFVNILDVDSLQVVRKISPGVDGFGIFIGRLSKRTGTVFVAKGLARQLYSIDPRTYEKPQGDPRLRDPPDLAALRLQLRRPGPARSHVGPRAGSPALHSLRRLTPRAGTERPHRARPRGAAGRALETRPPAGRAHAASRRTISPWTRPLLARTSRQSRW